MPRARKAAAAPAQDPRAACLLSRHVGGSPVPLAAPATRLRMVRGNRKHVRVASGATAADSDDDWPQTTDQWCWYCCHPFDTRPLPMPIKYDDRRDVFHVTGTFCSWACMKAHNGHSSSYMKSVVANYITLFHRRCTGKLAGIRPAPPRQALRVFGGTMTIEQFRRASEHDVEYCILPPKMVVHHQVVHEQQNTARLVSMQANKRAAPDLGQVVCFKDVATKNETLRLKRPKPLQNNRNLLERTMGIGALVQTL